MNFASPPSLHTHHVDDSDLLIFGNMKDTHALLGSDGMFRMPKCAAFIVLSSGSSTVSLLLIWVFFSRVSSFIMKFPVAPVSRMTRLFYSQVGSQTIFLNKCLFAMYLNFLACPPFMCNDYYLLDVTASLLLQCSLLLCCCRCNCYV